jgi:hypothetical protein
LNHAQAWFIPFHASMIKLTRTCAAAPVKKPELTGPETLSMGMVEIRSELWRDEGQQLYQ